MPQPLPQQDSQSVFPGVPTEGMRIDASPLLAAGRVGAGVQDIGAAIGQGADVLAQHAIRFQGMQNETAAKDADVKGMVAIGKLENDYYSKEGKNALDAYPAFQKGVQDLRSQMMANMPNAAAARMFDQVFARRVGYSVTAGSRYAAQQSKVYMTQTSEARVQASIDDATRHYNDPAWFQRSVGIVEDEARQQGEMMGWSPEVTAQHAATYRSEAWKARLMQVTDDNPQAALKMFEANSDQMDAQAQLQVEHGIRTAIKVQRSEARADADHAMALADHNLRIMQDTAAKNLWEKQFNGDLSLKDLEANKDTLNQADFTALGHAVTGEGSQHNDPEAVIALTQSQATEDPEIFGNDAAQMLRDKKITIATYQSMVGTNRTLLKDDQPLSPYRGARDALKQSLDPGLLSGAGSTMLRVNQANALKEYDDWTIANPHASRDQVFQQQQSILKRYQVMGFDQMSMTLGLPKYYSGSRNDITLQDLDAAESKALDAFDNDTGGPDGLNQSQLANELQRIKSWREILSKKASDSKAPPVPTDTTQPPANPANPGGP